MTVVFWSKGRFHSRSNVLLVLLASMYTTHALYILIIAGLVMDRL